MTEPLLCNGTKFEIGMTIFSISCGMSIVTSEESHEAQYHPTRGGWTLHYKTDRADSPGPSLSSFAPTWVIARQWKHAEELLQSADQKIAEGCRDLVYGNELMKSINPNHINREPINPLDYLKRLHFGFYPPPRVKDA